MSSEYASLGGRIGPCSNARSAILGQIMFSNYNFEFIYWQCRLSKIGTIILLVYLAPCLQWYNLLIVMDNVKIVSFDVEGTLVTTDFSYAIWFEAIPQCYAVKNGLDFNSAQALVQEEYEKVGDQRLEWYDVHYWFNKLGLGLPEPVMAECSSRIAYYPEVSDLLSLLSERYILTVASGSPREFLVHLLKDIEQHFTKVFSSVSDYKKLKTPDFYREMCNMLQMNPKQVIHVGDNWQFDFLAPSEVGIQAYYLDRTGKDNKPNILSSLAELKDFLM
jgi:putative hydrolase of the HAD superfamily